MRYRIKIATWTVVRDESEPSPHLLRTPDAIARLARDLVHEHDDDRERFWIAYCDLKLRLRFVSLIAVGSQDAAIVHPREVFGPALREGACGVVAMHNHPSGDPSPSREDLVMTDRLYRAGDLVGVMLIDHLIIGNGTDSWVSLRNHTEGGSSPWHPSTSK